MYRKELSGIWKKRTDEIVDLFNGFDGLISIVLFKNQNRIWHKILNYLLIVLMYS